MDLNFVVVSKSDAVRDKSNDLLQQRLMNYLTLGLQWLMDLLILDPQ